MNDSADNSMTEPMVSDHPLYALVKTSAGVLSILHRATGEIMHNPIGPWVEANALYVEQSRLLERWSRETSEFVVYDVGLGAGANALATLHCIRNARSVAGKRFRLVSFEKEMDLLHYALSHADQFPHFSGFQEAIRTLTTDGKWEDESITWELYEGDFLECVLETDTKPHFIYFDPYSPKMNPEMWSTESFKKLHGKIRTREEGGTSLYTYSQSTPVRVALLRAGFYVGVGHSTGLKRETTVASSHLHMLENPLGERWLKRWKTSQTPYPLLASEAEKPEIDEFITGHRQFLVSSQEP